MLLWGFHLPVPVTLYHWPILLMGQKEIQRYPPLHYFLSLLKN